MKICTIMTLLVSLLVTVALMGCNSTATPDKLCERAEGFDACAETLQAAQKSLGEDHWKTFAGCLEKKDKVTQESYNGCLDDDMKKKLNPTPEQTAPETPSDQKSGA